jgi:hypothetical protein
MRPKSLKSSLLVTIAFFVILSGLAIALLVTQRYSAALHATLMGQSENMAHAIALEAADRILINDLVGLQKLTPVSVTSLSSKKTGFWLIPCPRVYLSG